MNYWILGNLFLRNFYLTFDQAQMAIGLSKDPSDTDDNVIITPDPYVVIVHIHDTSSYIPGWVWAVVAISIIIAVGVTAFAVWYIRKRKNLYAHYQKGVEAES